MACLKKIRIERWQISNFRRETVLLLAYPFFVIIMIFLWICPRPLRRVIDLFAGKIYYKYGHIARNTALDNIIIVPCMLLEEGAENVVREPV